MQEAAGLERRDTNSLDPVIEKLAGNVRTYVLDDGFTLEEIKETFESEDEITAVKDWWTQVQQLVMRFKPELVTENLNQDKLNSTASFGPGPLLSDEEETRIKRVSL